jgi:hypothetical protein
MSLLVSSSVWAEFIASQYYEDNVNVKFKYKGHEANSKGDDIIDTWNAKLRGTVALGTFSGSNNIYGGLSTPRYSDSNCALTFVDETGSFEVCFDRISFILTNYYSKDGKKHPEKASITGTGLFYDGSRLEEGNISIICNNFKIQEDPNGNAISISSGLCNIDGGYSPYDDVNLKFSPGYTFTAIFNANYMLPE